MYGKGVMQDAIEAVKWYMRSSEHGNSDGQANLGYCYETGTGIQKSYEKAMEWYLRAAEQGNEYASERLMTLTGMARFG